MSSQVGYRAMKESKGFLKKEQSKEEESKYSHQNNYFKNYQCGLHTYMPVIHLKTQ